jgi:hypothetical protein
LFNEECLFRLFGKCTRLSRQDLTYSLISGQISSCDAMFSLINPRKGRADSLGLCLGVHDVRLAYINAAEFTPIYQFLTADQVYPLSSFSFLKGLEGLVQTFKYRTIAFTNLRKPLQHLLSNFIFPRATWRPHAIFSPFSRRFSCSLLPLQPSLSSVTPTKASGC